MYDLDQHEESQVTNRDDHQEKEEQNLVDLHGTTKKGYDEDYFDEKRQLYLEDLQECQDHQQK